MKDGWQCSQCGMEFERRNYTHVCNNVSYKCPICKMIISTGWFHSDEECRVNKENEVKCNWCMDSGFIGSTSLPCQRCGPSYKIWKCTHCSAVFSDEAECAEHECFCKKESDVKFNPFLKIRRESEVKCGCYFCNICGHYHSDGHKCLPDKKGEVKCSNCGEAHVCGESISCPNPTHSIEFTEEEIGGLLEAIGDCYPAESAEYKVLYAKLRSKKESDVKDTEYKHCPYCNKPVKFPCMYVCIDCQIKLFRESVVKDKVFCCEHCWDEFTDFYECRLHEEKCKGEPCIHPAQKGKPSGTTATGQSAYLDPTLTVELTEEDIGVIENAISRLWPTGYDLSALRAKLRPKKESVEFEVGEDIWAHKVQIFNKVISIYFPKHHVSGKVARFSRDTFERIYAAYEARKDEVKDGLG